jgi:chloride channel 3/4/5
MFFFSANNNNNLLWCALFSGVSLSLSPAKLREILSASAAVGVSVAFGAPIGGVLFSLESVSYYFPLKTMWRAFFAATIAALALQSTNPFHTGKLVEFQTSYNHSWRYFELPFFLVLGVVGGLLGALYIQLNTRVCEYRRRSWIYRYPVGEAILMAALTAVVIYISPLLATNSVSSLVASLFSTCDLFSPEAQPLCE